MWSKQKFIIKKKRVKGKAGREGIDFTVCSRCLKEKGFKNQWPMLRRQLKVSEPGCMMSQVHPLARAQPPLWYQQDDLIAHDITGPKHDVARWTIIESGLLRPPGPQTLLLPARKNKWAIVCSALKSPYIL